MFLLLFLLSIIIIIISSVIFNNTTNKRLENIIVNISFISSVVLLVSFIVSVVFLSYIISVRNINHNIDECKSNILVIETKINELPKDCSELDIIKLKCEYENATSLLSELYGKRDARNDLKWWLYFGGHK